MLQNKPLQLFLQPPQQLLRPHPIVTPASTLIFVMPDRDGIHLGCLFGGEATFSITCFTPWLKSISDEVFNETMCTQGALEHPFMDCFTPCVPNRP
jgi:hypothetical protein